MDKLNMGKCFMCDVNMVEQRTTYMADFGDSIVIVRNIPTLVCQQCGERAYTDDVATVLETIVAKAKGMLTEIAVVNYPAQVA